MYIAIKASLNFLLVAFIGMCYLSFENINIDVSFEKPRIIVACVPLVWPMTQSLWSTEMGSILCKLKLADTCLTDIH